MMDMHPAPQRGRCGFLGFVPPLAPANTSAPGSTDPDAALARCLSELQTADREMDALPDNGDMLLTPAMRELMDRMDVLLGRAATLRPASDRGFAIKARIARVYGDCSAGETVLLWLLSDLMIRGRA